MFLHASDVIQKGQIAHLNRRPADTRFENLVFLCLEHHDAYDSKTSQSRGFSIHEIRDYRDRLYRMYKSFGEFLTEDKAEESQVQIDPLPELSDFKKLRHRFDTETDFMSKPWSNPFLQAADEPEFFAYKSGNGCDGVCLIERIDVPDGRVAIACIQTAGNPGMSVTNCVEELCFQVCERFDIPADRLVWLEHYDQFGDLEWNLVTFASTPPNDLFRNPVWTPMTLAMWRQLGLRPKKRLTQAYGGFQSKLIKSFEWPKKQASPE